MKSFFTHDLHEEKINNVQFDIGSYIPLLKTKDNDWKYLTEFQIITKNYTIFVYNPFILELNSDPKCLIGDKILKVVTNENTFKFEMESGEILTIDLRDESYIGPEALCIYGPNDLIVVWN
jgi:hypothetical protein|tara:strand:- start:1649 stop:2011 length:363 start_codon:yes stop_codon:yes gene_type:complete